MGKPSQTFGVLPRGTSIAERRSSRLADRQSSRRYRRTKPLDQAGKLLEDGYLAAATVIAGGALETHLRHLVSRHGRTKSGAGTIGKHCEALRDTSDGKCRSILSTADDKQITAWGDLRNQAAPQADRVYGKQETTRSHDPGHPQFHLTHDLTAGPSVEHQRGPPRCMPCS